MSTQEIEKKIQKLEAQLNAIFQALSLALSEIEKIEETYQQGRSERWDPSRIKWIPAEGPSGPYEKAGKQEGGDYELMIQDLKNHQGRLEEGGLFFWLFSDSETVGRKPRK